MTVFLTSIIGPNPDGPIMGIYRKNRFLENLKRYWNENASVLLIAADPYSPRNDGWKGVMELCCRDGGLSVGDIALCDHRDLSFVNRLEDFDVIVLVGGHTPTQNAFFRRIGLKERIAAFSGLVIGISAGSMNCAEEVYAHPEKLGEENLLIDEKLFPGLGLTQQQIIPHYQEDKDTVLGGKRVMEDIAYPDSMGRRFLCLVDGSYLMCAGGIETVFGEAYEICNGALNQICRDDESIRIW